MGTRIIIIGKCFSDEDTIAHTETGNHHDDSNNESDTNGDHGGDHNGPNIAMIAAICGSIVALIVTVVVVCVSIVLVKRRRGRCTFVKQGATSTGSSEGEADATTRDLELANSTSMYIVIKDNSAYGISADIAQEDKEVRTEQRGALALQSEDYEDMDSDSCGAYVLASIQVTNRKGGHSMTDYEITSSTSEAYEPVTSKEVCYEMMDGDAYATVSEHNKMSENTLLSEEDGWMVAETSITNSNSKAHDDDKMIQMSMNIAYVDNSNLMKAMAKEKTEGDMVRAEQEESNEDAPYVIMSIND